MTREDTMNRGPALLALILMTPALLLACGKTGPQVERKTMRQVWLGNGQVCTWCSGVEDEPDVILKVYLDDRLLLRGHELENTGRPNWDITSPPFNSGHGRLKVVALESDSPTPNSEHNLKTLGEAETDIAQLPATGEFLLDLGNCFDTRSAKDTPCMKLRGEVKAVTEIVGVTGGPDVTLETLPKDLLGLRCPKTWIFNAPEEFLRVRILRVEPVEKAVRLSASLRMKDMNSGSEYDLTVDMDYRKGDQGWRVERIDCE